MRPVLNRPAIVSLVLTLCCVGASVAARVWTPSPMDLGLALTVDVPAGESAWTPVHHERASLPTLRALTPIATAVPIGPFRATWTGAFLATARGRHQFSVSADDGARLWVDDRLVVDNGGRHPRTRRSGSVTLAPGPHAIRVEYEEWGGERHLDTWLRQPGGLSRSVEDLRWQFAPDAPRASDRFRRRVRAALPWLSAWSAVIAYGAWLLAGGLAMFRWVERRATLPPADRRLGWLLTLAALVIATGITWGLPTDVRTWAPDEISPGLLLDAMEARFIAPWQSVYPPLHYYLLAPIAWMVPFVASADDWQPLTYPAVLVIQLGMRGLSVLMAVGVLAWLYLIVRLHGSTSQALATVVIASLCSTLLYYGKTANMDVPYLYWLFGALACVASAVRHWSRSLVVVGAILGVCAIGTKDQAAGFLLLVPLWLVVARRRHLFDEGHAHPWRRALCEPTWLLASVAALVTLAGIYLFPVDPTMLPRHLEAAQPYPPMVTGTLSGQLEFLSLEVSLVVFILGLPVALLSGVGFVWLVRAMPGLAIAIAVPALGYVGFLLPWVRYTYGRFLLGVSLLLICAAGPFVVWLWAQRRWRPAIVALSLVAVPYTVAYAFGATAMMARDSRYDVEPILQDRMDARHELVGILSPHMYAPRTDLTPTVDLEDTIADVQEWKPDALVFDRSWLERPDDREGPALLAALDTGRLGYRRAAVWQTPVPWWAVQMRPAYLVGYRGLTNLDKINPEIELWVRYP